MKNRIIWLCICSLTLLGMEADSQSLSGTIRGRVVDISTGAPVFGARIRVVRTIGGRVETGSTSGAGGEFVISGLDAGRYRIQVEAEGYQMLDESLSAVPGLPVDLSAQAPTANVTLRVVPGGGTIIGRLLDDDGPRTPLAGWQVVLMKSAYTPFGRRTLERQRVRTTSDNGEFAFSGIEPGTYYLRAESSRSQPFGNNTTGFGVFYPNVQKPDDAAPIVLTASTMGNYEFSVTQPKLGTLRGALANGDTSTALNLLMVRTDSNIESVVQISGVAVEGGTFEVSQVPEGSFDVYAASFLGTTPAIARTAAAVSPTGPDKEVTLRLEPANVGLDGQLRYTDGRLNGLRDFRIVFDIPYIGLGFPTTAVATTSENGTFRFDSLNSNLDYRLQITRAQLEPRTYVKRAWLNGLDVLHSPVRIPSTGGRLDIEVGTDGARLTGRVLDETTGEAFSRRNLVVLVRSPQPGPHTPHSILQATPNFSSDGRFALESVPPGRYLLFAFEWIPNSQPWQYGSEEFLRPFLRRGVVVDLGANTSRVQEVHAITRATIDFLAP